jgi:outer membrane protein assembly factor BamB
VIFTQLGDYEVKWVLPSTGAESNVVIVTVLEEVTKPSYAFTGGVPNPVGINQVVLVHVGITQQIGRVDDGWENLSLTIRDPEGIESVIEPIRTDSTGGTGVTFTPTKVGTYALWTDYPEQHAPNGETMLASTSEEFLLVVQEDPIPYHPGHSLPSEYWTRPIDAQLREWYTIAGDWPSTPRNNFAPYNDDAPDAPHILWAKTINMGGVAGGSTGEHAYSCGDAYEGQFGTRIILGGLLYYTVGGPRRTQPVVTYCVDLHTGEELWSKIFMDNRTVSFGQNFYWDAFNMHSVFSYLWVTRGNDWHAFDAYTGDWRFTMENVPSGTRIMGPNNEIMILRINTRANEMSLWSMDGWIRALPGSTAGSWGNTVSMQTLDADELDDCWLWTVPIPEGLSGGITIAGYGDKAVSMNVNQEEVRLWALSLEPGKEGTLLYDETWTAPAEWKEGQLQVRQGAESLIDNVGTLRVKEKRQMYGFSFETGKYLWGPSTQQHYLDNYRGGFSGERDMIGYGKVFSGTMSGIFYCHDAQTGQLLWTYEMNDPYQEILWSNNWPIEFGFLTDGKVYIWHTEHSVIDPKPRDAPWVCLDVEDGSVVFKADGLSRSTIWGGDAIIGDSIIVTQNTYDQRLVAFGKGPSTTTVTAPDTSVPLGSGVMIKGTVMDVSPGTEDPGLKMRFANGVPAVSDADMGEWMTYVYQQFERPTVSGVTVKIEAVDPNYNYQNYGTTTTDPYGNFALAIEPEVPGTYMIIATFEGSDSYYGSTATTYFMVEEAPAASTPIEPEVPTEPEEPIEPEEPTEPEQPTEPEEPEEPTTPEEPEEPEEPTEPEQPATEAPLISTEVAILAAITIAVMIGLGAFWALRKRQ